MQDLVTERPVSSQSNVTNGSSKNVSTLSAVSTIFGVDRKDKIYKKYLKINNKRFKVTVLNSTSQNCLLVYLERKPANFRKRLIVTYEDFIKTFSGDLSKKAMEESLDQGLSRRSS